MNEIYAALIGASISALLMVLSNRSNRTMGNFREIYHRLNAVEKDIARLETKPNRNWRNN
jgi:hypothetical protein|tara:strand:+ start:324 stop:503 length:180 start_codon:yes stop_codon:yes gene_type:complete